MTLLLSVSGFDEVKGVVWVKSVTTKLAMTLCFFGFCSRSRRGEFTNRASANEYRSEVRDEGMNRSHHNMATP